MISRLKNRLRYRARKLAGAIAARLGVRIIRVGRWDALEAERHAMLSQLARAQARHEDGVECIIFSMDRPIQLAALLASLREKMSPRVRLHVLYRASNPDYEAAYREVFAWVNDDAIFAHPEKSFAADLRSLLKKITVNRIFFLVDDILFIDQVDMAAFAAVDTEAFVPSLRHGVNIHYCFTGDIRMRQPASLTTRGDGLLSWRWSDGGEDWGYALSVDGHVFATAEIAALFDILSFRSPNSLESAMQDFAACFADRQGLAFSTSRLVNIPANRVQNEIDNRAGNVSPETLLAAWQQGLMIDYRAFYGLHNSAVHEEHDYSLVPRSPAFVVV